MKSVVFVCEYGSKKSLLAASYFNRFAAAEKLPFRAVSRGLDPDPEVPEWIQSRLVAEGFDTSEALRPLKLSTEDVAAAGVLVSFSANVPSGAAGSVRDWGDIPPLSEDYAHARDAIVTRVRDLVRELAEARA
jgi:protein-tyrosine-phosphatase